MEEHPSRLVSRHVERFGNFIGIATVINIIIITIFFLSYFFFVCLLLIPLCSQQFVSNEGRERERGAGPNKTKLTITRQNNSIAERKLRCRKEEGGEEWTHD